MPQLPEVAVKSIKQYGKFAAYSFGAMIGLLVIFFAYAIVEGDVWQQYKFDCEAINSSKAANLKQSTCGTAENTQFSTTQSTAYNLWNTVILIVLGFLSLFAGAIGIVFTLMTIYYVIEAFRGARKGGGGM